MKQKLLWCIFIVFIFNSFIASAQSFKKVTTLGTARQYYSGGKITRFGDYFIITETDTNYRTRIISVNVVSGDKEELIIGDTARSSPFLATTIIDNKFYCFFNNKLWRTDGTAANTVSIANIPFTELELIHYNNKVYFLTSSDTLAGLWRTDGSKEGTILLQKSPNKKSASNLYVFKSQLYYGISDKDSIHITIFDAKDSTSKILFSNYYYGINETMPKYIFTLNSPNKLYFRSMGAIGLNLIFETDGTKIGTHPTFAVGFYGQLFLDGNNLYLGITRGTQQGSFYELLHKDLLTSKIDTIHSVKELYTSFRDFQKLNDHLIFFAFGPFSSSNLFQLDRNSLSVDTIPAGSFTSCENLIPYKKIVVAQFYKRFATIDASFKMSQISVPSITQTVDAITTLNQYDIDIEPLNELFVFASITAPTKQIELWKLEDEVTSVTNPNISKQSIYPNPATTEIFVDKANLSAISIATLAGVQIMRIQEAQIAEQIDITSLCAGAYFVTLTDKQNATHVMKLIKY